MSTIAVNSITDASGGTTASINGHTPTASNMAGRNRIINGDMRIDQRNAGASVTPYTGEYALDRWECRLSVASKYSVQQSTDVPAGFTNSMLCTSLSAYSVGASETFFINQKIEGYNIADLGWGTANAKTVTLSFWVRSSLTGTFGGSLRNSASNRSYPFSYSISAADTWEQKSITIAGDTSGTWLTTNGTGIGIVFSLGTGATLSGTAGAWASANYHNATGATSVVGTSGATFYLTGVQLEVGSTATEFEHRLYGQELGLCQRYYEFSDSTFSNPMFSGNVTSGNLYYTSAVFKVTKRAVPTVTLTSTYGTYFPNTSGNALSLTTGSFYEGRTASSTGTGFFASTWTASAEL